MKSSATTSEDVSVKLQLQMMLARPEKGALVPIVSTGVDLNLNPNLSANEIMQQVDGDFTDAELSLLCGLRSKMREEGVLEPVANEKDTVDVIMQLYRDLTANKAIFVSISRFIIEDGSMDNGMLIRFRPPEDS